MTSTQNMAWVEASLHLARNFTESGGSKIVLGSSCAEYDWQYGYCHEEITPISPHSLYGECKASLNKIFKKYCRDRKSTRLNSSHVSISYAVFCLKKKKKKYKEHK